MTDGITGVNMIYPADILGESWIDKLPPNRLTAAYHAGRLSNCMNWLLTLHALMRNRHPKKLEGVLDKLVRMSHRFDDPTQDAPIRWVIETTYRDWQKWVKSTGGYGTRHDLLAWMHAQDLCDEGFPNLEEEVEWLPDTEEEREEAWGHSAVDWSNPIRTYFSNSMDSREELCLDLGYRLDQGCRPLRSRHQGLKRAMSKPGIAPSLLKELDPMWKGDVEGLLDRLRIRDALRTDVSNATLARLTRLDSAIREHLTSSAAVTPETPGQDDAAERPAQVVVPDSERSRERCDLKELEGPRKPKKAGKILEEPVPTPGISEEQPPEPCDLNELDILKKLKKEIDPGGKYIGQSLPILRMFEQIALFNSSSEESSKSLNPILLLGETGAGKSVLAKLIHQHSGRNGKFKQISATANAIDSTAVRHFWLGHGAKSGLQDVGKDAQDGIIQECQGGTIFLDEFHVTPPWFQTELLSVLDGHKMERPHGIADPIQPDVRMLFASNWTWEKLAEMNHDLLDRLKRWTITVPPLRARKEDIVCFIEKWCKEYHKQDHFLLALFRYAWPGNVRELKEALEIGRRLAGDPPTPLALGHLRLDDRTVVGSVRQMDDDQAKRAVWQFLVRTFEQQGLRKGRGLQKRLAEFWGVREPAVSKTLKRLGIDLAAE